MDVAGWATAAAEVLIAVVIYWELEEGRLSKFLDEAYGDKMYQLRRDIYLKFFDLPGDSIPTKTKHFSDILWEDGELRMKCERQIVFFGRLDQIYRHAFFRRRAYVGLFPHTVVLFWIMLEPFIEQRQKLSGSWWAIDFMELTEQCVRFTLKKPNAKFTLFDADRKRKSDLIVTTDELRKLQARLKDRMREAA